MESKVGEELATVDQWEDSGGLDNAVIDRPFVAGWEKTGKIFEKHF